MIEMPKQKITLIGAGSLTFGMGTVGSIINSKVLEGSTICLHDIDGNNLELVRRACEAAIDRKKVDFTLEATTDRPTALKNTSFIINSIEITPRFELLNLDYTIPLQHGCKQVSGENGGPGGLFHSLRVIPPILEICADIQKICPKVFLINFSNPMTRVCLAIKRKFPALKFVGLCHEFQHFRLILSRILNTPQDNIDAKGYGLNHFGVITECHYKDTGKDAMAEIWKKGPQFLSQVDAYDGFKFIAFFLEKYRYCPYTTDSHYGEYIHWAWEKADIFAIRRFWKIYQIDLTSTYKKLKRIIEKGKGSRLVKPDDESAIPIIEGIITNSNHVEHSVNIPNDDIITNLPRDLVVECPATVNKDGLTGIPLGEYPFELLGYIQTQLPIIDLCLESIFQKSKDLALKAILAEPLIETYGQAERIFNDLLKLEENYLSVQFE
jgi:alpha-galactosidase